MIKNINDWEVFTPSGWSKFDGIKQTTSKQVLQIFGNDGLINNDEIILICTTNHMLLRDNNTWIKAIDIKVGHKLRYVSENYIGFITISKIEILDEETLVYDLLNVENDHTYLTNNLASHNCAFIPNNIVEELWESAYPTISSSKDSKVILVSTPNGTGNLFYDLYNAGLTKEGREDVLEKWIPFRIDWWDVPDRDEEWKQKQIVAFNYNMRRFNQEFGNCIQKDTQVTVRDKLTGEIFDMTIENLFKKLELNVF